MLDKQHLLTDAQMQQFIVEGYITVQANYGDAFHQDLYQRLEGVLEKEKNPGNNILPRVPQIQQVFDHPNVHGALTSLLGPNYVMNSHRFCHLNAPGSKGQRWHKDSYVFDEMIRHPRPRWVLAFYYPQAVTADMGPSVIIPGRQYHQLISDDNPASTTEIELPICGPTGMVALMHYDCWHRGSANHSDQKRYMLKFLFERLEEPQEPTWNNVNPQWQSDASDEHWAVNKDVWHWLAGHKSSANAQAPAVTANGDSAAAPQQDAVSDLVTALQDRDENVRSDAANGLARLGSAALSAVRQLQAALQDESESVRLNAAYALGAMGEAVIPLLIDALRSEAVAAADQLSASTPANAYGTNPPACYAGLALSAIGQPAVLPLAELLQHDHWCVRVMAADTLSNIGLPAQEAVAALTERLGDEHARVRRQSAEALGRLGAAAANAVPALIERVRDTDVHVRHNVALALAKIGQPANEAIPPLLESLADEDRYVRYYAAVALRHIPTAEAQKALFDALFVARWCPLTTQESLF